MAKNTIKWPVSLVALDLVGALIAAIGILKYIEHGSFNALLLIVVGFCLMLPLILHIFKLLPRKGTERDKPNGEH
jgi:hypothetical protein